MMICAERMEIYYIPLRAQCNYLKYFLVKVNLSTSPRLARCEVLKIKAKYNLMLG